MLTLLSCCAKGLHLRKCFHFVWVYAIHTWWYCTIIASLYLEVRGDCLLAPPPSYLSSSWGSIAPAWPQSALSNPDQNWSRRPPSSLVTKVTFTGSLDTSALCYIALSAQGGVCFPEPQSRGKSGAVLRTETKCGPAFAAPARPSTPPMSAHDTLFPSCAWSPTVMFWTLASHTRPRFSMLHTDSERARLSKVTS